MEISFNEKNVLASDSSTIFSKKSQLDKLQAPDCSDWFQCQHLISAHTHKSVHNRHKLMFRCFLLVECISGDQSAKHTPDVLKQGHCGRGKDPCQTGGYGNRLKGLCGMIEGNESRGLKLLSGSATPLRPATSDVI